MSSVVNHYNNRYEQSIVDGLRAEKHALATSDHLLLGLIYRTIADGFDRLYDWSSALHYYTLSYDNFKLAPENIYTDWAFYDIARVNYSLGHFAKVAAILENHPETIDIESDNPLTAGLLRLVAAANHYLHNYETTDSIYDYVSTMQNNDLIATDYRLWGQSAFKIGDLESALVCKDSLYLEDSSDRTLDCELAKFRHEYAEAFDLLEQSISEDNDKLSKVLERNYAATISGYYSAEASNAAHLQKRERLIAGLLIAMCIIILFIVLLSYKYKTLLLHRKIDDEMRNALKLRKIIEDNEIRLRNADTEIDKLLILNRQAKYELLNERQNAAKEARNKIKEIFAVKFDMIEQLCDAYFTNIERPDMQAKISKQVISIIDGMKSDSKTLSQLEKIVNRHLDDVIKRFRSDFPNLKNWEYSLFLFCILGFSPRVISIFQGVKTELIYTRKSVLKRKITAVSEISTTEYLDYLT